MTSKYHIELSEIEERVLRQRAAQYTRPHREVLRAKIVLLAAQGYPNVEIARRLDCTERSVHKWRRRFFEEGLPGLEERGRPGRPRSFSPLPSGGDQGACLRASGGVRPASLPLVGG